MRIAGAAALLLAGAAAAQPPVACASSDAAICRMIASREFLTAYQGAYRQGSDPADAVDDLRFNMRRVLTGSVRAGPGAVSQQIDAILDDALRRTQQQLCAASPDFVARCLRACGRPGPRSRHARCAVVRRDARRNDGRSPRVHTVRPRGLSLFRPQPGRHPQHMFVRLAATAPIGAAMAGAAAAEVGAPRKLSAGEVLAEARQNGLVVGPAIVDEDLDLGRLVGPTEGSAVVFQNVNFRGRLAGAPKVPLSVLEGSICALEAERSEWSQPADFRAVKLGSARFREARLSAAWTCLECTICRAGFQGTPFGGEATFIRTQFGQPSAEDICRERAPRTCTPPISPKRHSRAPLASITRRSGQRRVSTAWISRRAHYSHACPPRRP